VLPLSCAAAVLAIAPAPNDQPSPFFVPPDELSIRVMNDVPAVDLAPGVHVRTVVATTGSFSLGEFEPGSAAALHHHTREQADVAVSGEFDVTLGYRTEKLRPRLGLIIPADVPHSISNKGHASAIVAEFHTVRRPDLVPPRPVMTFPAADKPADPPDRPLIVAMSAGTTLRGETCVMSLRVFSEARNASVAAGSVEHFLYLAAGAVRLTSAGRSTRVVAGSLVVVPAGKTVAIHGAPEATVAEFIPSASHE
jgi:quercetin dioxygenase-like cupin family protein